MVQNPVIDLEAYSDGSDALILVGGKAIGHCTTHSVDLKNDTKERLVKPKASEANADSRWKSKSISGSSVTISGDGLVSLTETEAGYELLLGYAADGIRVEIVGRRRGTNGKISVYGHFVLTSVTKTSPAGEDETYSFTAENDGKVYFGDKAATQYAADHGGGTIPANENA